MEKILICGDFNSRIGEESDYIMGVDNIPVRNVIDATSNKHGDHLLEFLIDCNLCIVNGRVGLNDFTHVSHRCSSVVDYVIVPLEQLSLSTHLSRLVGKPTMWFPNRSDTNRPVHVQKHARSLKFWC